MTPICHLHSAGDLALRQCTVPCGSMTLLCHHDRQASQVRRSCRRAPRLPVSSTPCCSQSSLLAQAGCQTGAWAQCRKTSTLIPARHVHWPGGRHPFEDSVDPRRQEIVQHIWCACRTRSRFFHSSSIIGPEEDPDYDRTIFLPSAMSDAAVLLLGVLEEHAFSGVPQWPFVPSTLHAAFLAGESGRACTVVTTWDA